MAKKPAKPRTEIVHASELHERVILPIARLRDKKFAEEEKAFPKKLAEYEQKRGDRPEVEGSESSGMFSIRAVGYYEIASNGKPVFVPRPRRPSQDLAGRFRTIAA